MIRSLKAIGLALVVVFVFSALFASMAFAQQGFLTSDGPVTLFGEETGEPSSNTWTMFGASMRCPGSVYTGHKVGSTAQIPSGSIAATITPHYKQSNCRGFDPSEYRTTVSMNGCDYVFRIGSTVSSNTYPVTADIVCPSESEGIHFSVYGLGDPTHTGTRLCTFELTPQTGLTGAHVSTNIAADNISVVGTFHSIHMDRTGLCAFDGKGNTTTVAEWHIDVTFTGLNAIGSPTGVTVS